MVPLIMSSSSSVRSWRTAFLSLRDETQTIPSSPSSLPLLLGNLIFSHSQQSLLSAASDLPAPEVTSDLLFLMDLVANSPSLAYDPVPIFTQFCRLFHDIGRGVYLDLNSASWTLILQSLGNMLHSLLSNTDAATLSVVLESLDTLRRIMAVYLSKCPPSDSILLVKFLLPIIHTSHLLLVRSNPGRRPPAYSSLWEVQTVAFSMLGESFSRFGSSFPLDLWQSTLEVVRKVMDSLASRTLLDKNDMLTRFYTSLLHCLHFILVDPKCALAEHVSGLITTLRMFFVYGISGKLHLKCPAVNQNQNEHGLMHRKLNSEEPPRTVHSPYRPPHLRKKERLNMKQPKALDSQSLSDQESSMVDFVSSDSDYSDNDGSLIDTNDVRSSKVRVAAIVCIQDLCQADPKSFTTQWTILLPTSNVLQPRKSEATLLTCLMFDPYLKARIASASALAVMMDGPSSIFLQVAEYKEATKFGSFMALSSSLGRILMQLHSGISYLIHHETNSRLLAALFKILVLLISCTPYLRMPRELLPTMLKSLQERIEVGFPQKVDQTGLLLGAISCLTAALSTSPSSPQVKEMLLEEASKGFVKAENVSGVLFTIFYYSEQPTNSAICFEALQALRALSHNYPSIMFACWDQVSTIVDKILRLAAPGVPTRTWKGHLGNTSGFIGEKIITAAVKVLDECLRSISEFKGTEDLLDDKFLDTPFTFDCVRTKKVSSAPSHENAKESKACQSGSEQWSEAIERHIPMILWHTSGMVRTASVTCFAGITSSVFFSFTKEQQNFVISSLIKAAVHDEIPSVRSAACRAIGVISCFPQISQSAEMLDKFIHAVEINTRDPVISVRITASWALANICDSLRHYVSDGPLKESEDPIKTSRLMVLLCESALRLTKDGDKVKSNAVRALGNLSRFFQYKSLPHVDNESMNCMGFSMTTHDTVQLPASRDLKINQRYMSNSCHPEDSVLLEKMVQAFLSCITTGNVKVQWNVCHALSNLFLNETLRLQDMDWAPSVFSVLLLLLRDSSNFKIRIQAAYALSVPVSAPDYGKCFSDVIQGLEHVLENLGSDKISAPSSFKYRVALEKQLTSTMLHVLSLASSADHQPLKDFLVRKASFLEEWFKVLSSSLGGTSSQPEIESVCVINQKKDMIGKALQSLIEVYRSKNNHVIAQKFEKLNGTI